MKIVKSLLFVSVWLTCSVTGCRKDIKPVDIEVDDKGISTVTVQDSLEAKFMMQSNVELMLADRFISKNSTYVLDISEQEAGELHIPSELYQKYFEIVKNMNSSNEEAGLPSVRH